MEIENQFQLNEGPKFSNPLKYSAFKPRFIDAGPPCVFQHWQQPGFAPVTHVCIYNHTGNICQEAFMSTQGRTQQTWWDLRYHRPKVRGQYNLMFFYKAVFQDYLQGRFCFYTLVQISTFRFRDELMWQQPHASRHRIPQKQRGFCYM